MCGDYIHHLSLLRRLFQLSDPDRLRVKSSSYFTIHASVINENRFRDSSYVDTHHLFDLSMQSSVTRRSKLMNLPGWNFQTWKNSFWTPRD